MNVPTTGQSTQSASGQAITALVLGIVGLVCCQLVSPIAWWLGNQERKAIREGRAPAAGDTLAMVAVILGIIGTILLVLGLVWVFFLGGMAVLSAMGSGAGAP